MPVFTLFICLQTYVFRSDGKRNVCGSTQGWKISSIRKQCVCLCWNLLQQQEINLPKAWLLLSEDWATGSEHCLRNALGNKKQWSYKTLLLVIFRLLTSCRHPCQDGHLGGRDGVQELQANSLCFFVCLLFSKLPLIALGVHVNSIHPGISCLAAITVTFSMTSHQHNHWIQAKKKREKKHFHFLPVHILSFKSTTCHTGNKKQLSKTAEASKLPAVRFFMTTISWTQPNGQPFVNWTRNKV